MCVEALGFVVVVIEGTPLCFEVKNKELEVGLAMLLGVFEFQGLDQVQQSHFDVLNTVCEATVVAIVASINVVGISVAKFSFVFLRVVKAFDSVV